MKNVFKKFIDLFYIEETNTKLDTKNIHKNNTSMKENSLFFKSKFFNYSGHLTEKNYLLSLNHLNNTRNLIIANNLGGKNKFLNDFIKRNKKFVFIGSFNREYSIPMTKISKIDNYFSLLTFIDSEDERFLLNNMIDKENIDFIKKFIKEKTKQGFHIIVDTYFLNNVSVYDPKYFRFKSEIIKGLEACNKLTFLHDNIENIDTTLTNNNQFVRSFNNILFFNNNEFLENKEVYFFDELIKHNLPPRFTQDKIIILKKFVPNQK